MVLSPTISLAPPVAFAILCALIAAATSGCATPSPHPTVNGPSDQPALTHHANDPAAQAAQQRLHDTRFLRTDHHARQHRDREIARQRIENARATIPYTNLQTYPQHWPRITQRRLQSDD